MIFTMYATMLFALFFMTASLIQGLKDNPNSKKNEKRALRFMAISVCIFMWLLTK